MYLIYLKGNKRKIVDDAYHGKVHWKRPQQLEKEAIAEMFETIATCGTRQEAMLKYFPSAFSYFENCIKGLLK